MTTAPKLIDFQAGATTTETRCQTVYESAATGSDFAEVFIGLYGGYCLAAFESLAATSPAALAELIERNRAPESRLTFAVEILGRDVRDPWVARELLAIIRKHRSPLVREGAVLGLAHHLDRLGVREGLREAATEDPSRGVREAALEVLDDE